MRHDRRKRAAVKAGQAVLCCAESSPVQRHAEDINEGPAQHAQREGGAASSEAAARVAKAQPCAACCYGTTTIESHTITYPRRL